MNKIEFKNVLKRYKFSGTLSEAGASTVTEITETANENSLVLYKLLDEKESLSKLEHRLKNIQAAQLLIFSSSTPTIKTNIPTAFFNIDFYDQVAQELIKLFYPKSFEVILAGVTGTNGKSTVVHLCRELCGLVRVKAASIGTLGVYVANEKTQETVNTSPGCIELARILSELRTTHNVSHSFLEVSSHALMQNRLGPFRLSVAGWTSFSRDHLDYHKTMEAYFQAKTKIALYLNSSSKEIVVPEHDIDLCSQLKKHHVAYKSVRLATVPANPFFALDYNQNNLSVAIGMLEKLQIKINEKDADKISGPIGRFELINRGKFNAIVDYAHSPDGLKVLLQNTKRVYSNKRIGVVFGCGGDRDNGKRPLMGAIAMELADKVIVTSDNPRTEDPNRIIKMIVENFQNDPQAVSKLIIESDRKKAIVAGVSLLRQKKIDVLVVAGKGHEQYQDVNERRSYFSDQDELRKSFAEDE